MNLWSSILINIDVEILQKILANQLPLPRKFDPKCEGLVHSGNHSMEHALLEYGGGGVWWHSGIILCLRCWHPQRAQF